MSNSLTTWLEALGDQRHRHNWSVVKQPDDHLACRFWMVLLPRGEMRRIKFVYEYAEHDGVVDMNGGAEVTRETLDFWYDCQRDLNDW